MSPVSFTGEPFGLPEIPQARIAAQAAAAETAMRVRMKAIGEAAAADQRSRIHSRSGTLASSVTVHTRLLKGETGVSMSVGPIKAVAFDTRKGEGGAKKQDAFYGFFVERGTGMRGPLGTRIKNRGRIRAGGHVITPSGRGQRPQHIFLKAREHYDAALRPAVDREVQRVLAEQFAGLTRRGVR